MCGAANAGRLSADSFGTRTLAVGPKSRLERRPQARLPPHKPLSRYFPPIRPSIRRRVLPSRIGNWPPCDGECPPALNQARCLNRIEGRRAPPAPPPEAHRKIPPCASGGGRLAQRAARGMTPGNLRGHRRPRLSLAYCASLRAFCARPPPPLITKSGRHRDSAANWLSSRSTSASASRSVSP